MRDDPAARKKVARVERAFAKQQRLKKDQLTTQALLAMSKAKQESPKDERKKRDDHKQKNKYDDRKYEDKKEANKGDAKGKVFSPVELEKGENLHPSLKGFMIPKQGSARLGHQNCMALDKPPLDSFRYQCLLCLKDGHHMMNCGASELGLPPVVTRLGENKQIITYRELFKRSRIDALAKRV